MKIYKNYYIIQKNVYFNTMTRPTLDGGEGNEEKYIFLHNTFLTVKQTRQYFSYLEVRQFFYTVGKHTIFFSNEMNVG